MHCPRQFTVVCFAVCCNCCSCVVVVVVLVVGCKALTLIDIFEGVGATGEGQRGVGVGEECAQFVNHLREKWGGEVMLARFLEFPNSARLLGTTCEGERGREERERGRVCDAYHGICCCCCYY